MKLEKKYCVDHRPEVGGAYNESEGLLAFTCYGNYILCTYRVNCYGIGMFYTGAGGKPYSYCEVVYWCKLPVDGGER